MVRLKEERVKHTVLTIGTSNLGLDAFIGNLQAHNVKALVDVRSKPFSRLFWFNQDALAKAVAACGIEYLYGGRILGGQANYKAQDPLFVLKMDRIVDLALFNERPAMMCAEGDPADCHRAGKLTRWLHVNRPDLATKHILRSGELVDGRLYEPKIKPAHRDLTMGDWPVA